MAAQIRAVAADPEVGTIVMDVDSPGGSVFGVQELADTLYDVREHSGKRLVAVANNMAASGGYWIASQAHELVVTPSGMGGSIGFADPSAKLSFGYTMNRMGAGILLNPRGQSLVDAAYQSLGWRSDASGAWHR